MARSERATGGGNPAEALSNNSNQNYTHFHRLIKLFFMWLYNYCHTSLEVTAVFFSCIDLRGA